MNPQLTTKQKKKKKKTKWKLVINSINYSETGITVTLLCVLVLLLQKHSHWYYSTETLLSLSLWLPAKTRLVGRSIMRTRDPESSHSARGGLIVPRWTTATCHVVGRGWMSKYAHKVFSAFDLLDLLRSYYLVMELNNRSFLKQCHQNVSSVVSSLGRMLLNPKL